MVLAATAIPIELRPLGQVALNFGLGASDALANVAGYVPVGIVLAGLGSLRAVIAAAMLAVCAETSQFAMVHRDPSAVDVAANVIGAIIGTWVSGRWKIRAPEVRITTPKAMAAALLVFAVIVSVWASSGDPLNERGVTSPGALEAYWKLDEGGGRVARDSATRGRDGRFSRDSVPVAGMAAGAVKFDGRRDYIDFGHSTSFRLIGSMTISAWVKSTSFPADDAAIVSSLNGDADTAAGYQLDTTVDRGQRTVGFKLGNACGRLMARYGATPLVVGVWYHLAGVYNADTRTLDVYLNGQLDNGLLLGSVTAAQHSSRSALYVGRRSDSEGFEFAGAIDDVHVYSRPLSQAEIALEMRGTVVDDGRAQPAGRKLMDNVSSGDRDAHAATCAVVSDRKDAQVIPIAAAGIGVLAATACVGLWASSGWVLRLLVSLATGCLLLPATSSNLPALNLWLIPVTSFAGGASVALSVKPRTKM